MSHKGGGELPEEFVVFRIFEAHAHLVAPLGCCRCQGEGPTADRARYESSASKGRSHSPSLYASRLPLGPIAPLPERPAYGPDRPFRLSR